MNRRNQINTTSCVQQLKADLAKRFPIHENSLNDNDAVRLAAGVAIPLPATVTTPQTYLRKQVDNSIQPVPGDIIPQDSELSQDASISTPNNAVDPEFQQQLDELKLWLQYEAYSQVAGDKQLKVLAHHALIVNRLLEYYFFTQKTDPIIRGFLLALSEINQYVAP